jgi:hypothetical protein
MHALAVSQFAAFRHRPEDSVYPAADARSTMGCGIYCTQSGDNQCRLSMFEEANKAQAMRDAGAVAYLTKSGPAHELINSIRTSSRSLDKAHSTNVSD